MNGVRTLVILVAKSLMLVRRDMKCDPSMKKGDPQAALKVRQVDRCQVP